MQEFPQCLKEDINFLNCFIRFERLRFINLVMYMSCSLFYMAAAHIVLSVF